MKAVISSVATCAALASLALAPTVFAPAALADDAFEVAFAFSRSALQSDEGAREIYADLTSNVRLACRSEVHARGAEQVLEIRQCAEPMIEEAVGRIGSSRLSAIHAGAEGRFANAEPAGRVALADNDA